MIESEHRGVHWRSTKTNALLSIGILIGILITVSLLSDFFTRWHFLGFPFVFFLAAQGAFILMIIIVFWSAGRQEKIDRRHGASEEI